jgi:hypothetical protein
VLTIPAKFPVFQQFLLMFACPLQNESQSTTGQFTVKNLQFHNISEDFIFSILRVEVRRAVIPSIHID